jgi:hypothetical protein
MREATDQFDRSLEGMDAMKAMVADVEDATAKFALLAFHV